MAVLRLTYSELILSTYSCIMPSMGVSSSGIPRNPTQYITSPDIRVKNTQAFHCSCCLRNTLTLRRLLICGIFCCSAIVVPASIAQPTNHFKFNLPPTPGKLRAVTSHIGMKAQNEVVCALFAAHKRIFLRRMQEYKFVRVDIPNAGSIIRA